MIPRLKPFLDVQEILNSIIITSNAVPSFEQAFADKLTTTHAIAYPYGRSALWAFFKTVGLENAEIIMPAYTCSVVGHAVVLSGNIPRFVDIDLRDYNMNLELLAAAINPKTRVIIATHLFGYPMNIDALREIVNTAETRYGHKIWIIQDCAHSFGAEWQGKPVQNAGDVAVFGLNISKTMTSIFGGMLTTQDGELASQLQRWRDQHFQIPNMMKGIQRRLYLGAIYPAFNDFLYGLVYWLQENTTALKGLTDAYHLDEKIHFPPDAEDQMLPVEAQVGLAQVKKYDAIIRKRRDNAQAYCDGLQAIASDEFVLPPLVDGATYSHFVIRVPNRDEWVRKMAARGIQLGILIEYSMPEMTAYQPYRNGAEYPNALYCSHHMINLPIHANVSHNQRSRIIQQTLNIAGRG